MMLAAAEGTSIGKKRPAPDPSSSSSSRPISSSLRPGSSSLRPSSNSSSHPSSHSATDRSMYNINVTITGDVSGNLGLFQKD
mmetsp:Transcript_32995/g.72656  ORF Transcript_32995/g.72656 Transcript_32995/m.72656 type:complete len:82 (-) Transcript_32995:67-312(-)